MDRQIRQLIQEGSTSVSNLLLKNYKRMSLADEEMMLIIHLLSFQQEGNQFPTLSQLEDRLSMSGLRLIQLLQKMMKDQWIGIDENVDEQTGFRSESYNLSVVYDRLYDCLKQSYQVQREAFSDSRQEVAVTSHMDISGGPADTMLFSLDEEQQPDSLYTQFEQTFGRPLSPIEVETLQIWAEEDGYAEELIIAALREAQFVGKLFIRYIDRILLEWQRNQVNSVEEAREYSQRFRHPVAVKEGR
ncbi:DnaD domain protein [Brevibacillus laterosporus]|uniref:DnaD domain-containing protein n=1 Tax=Brevibacillus laterosporus TaxID=1465 RepID=UPI000CE35C56|nr:DnaD domain protein [Brevibacillus laterosporus]MBG9772025.1 DNA replication protein DnaD [Brevibacillus laterosporus]MBG9797362.1 DNA replication protein DnaD [Brevibacillus laterosporus]MCR8936302.1 DnaD domain protein [Brevibacillus laterosporus]MCZ0838941.1 DnaD domain protein [Brevibacillus laterosporus]MCZ0845778.1 DnaD domain protein [Brevibacillus laterosporus]